jgi:hypothetical protein
MNNEEFWVIIEESKSVLSSTDRDGNLERQAEYVQKTLSQLDKDEILDYVKIYHELSQSLYTWELWGAAYVIAGGCSDDSFSDFRSWIISLGKDAYELAIVSPDELGPLSKGETVEDVFFEELSYVADEVFEEKFDEEIELDFSFLSEPKGKKWDEEDVEKLYPKLSELYA